MVSNGKIIILRQSSHENIPQTSCSVNSLAPRANYRALSGAVVEEAVLPPAALTPFRLQAVTIVVPFGQIWRRPVFAW
jgi:hypothetical protein